MVMFRAHFDGKVLVPDEPVSIPAGLPLRVTLVVESEAPSLSKLTDIARSFGPDPTWPRDGAAEIDHYLYSTPKRAG